MTKLHEVSLAKALSVPWASTLISMTPSNIRTEPSTPPHPHTGTPSRPHHGRASTPHTGTPSQPHTGRTPSPLTTTTSHPHTGTPSHTHSSIDSVLFNVSGKLLMVQQEGVGPFTQDSVRGENEVSAIVEMMRFSGWTFT